MKKKSTLLILLTLMLISMIGTLTGCGKKDKNSDAVTNTIKQTTEEVKESTEAPIVENHDNEVRSKLTGLWVPKEVGNKRPYAIAINNIKIASPQSGTEEADVLYEAIVEGGITRLLGIYETLNEKRIGSIRSARHYFVSFADEYDAIYVHFGQTIYATRKIEELGIDNLSGLSGIGTTVFYRDNSIKAPHNAFTSAEGLKKGTEIKGYDTEYDKDYEGHFTFYEEDTDINSDKVANKVTFNYTNYTSPYFTYNADDKLYYRFQFGEKHIDKNSGKQLRFKNIIVQFVKEWDIDKHDYQTMDIENSSGKGYYITNGKMVDITWKKNEATKKMRYYDSQGNELTMNPGKTYIAIFPKDRVEDVVVSDTK